MTECKRRIGMMIAAAVVVMNVSAAGALDQASGTKTANCVVRIISPRESFPINPDVIERLLLSTPVISEPLREIVGSTALSYEDDVIISFEPLNLSEQKEYTMVVGIISVDIHGGGALKAAAAEFLAEICRRLETALKNAGEVSQTRLQAVERELAAMHEKYEGLRQLRRQIIEEAGQDDLSRERIIAETRELEERTADLRLRLAAAEARENAVAKNIARISEQTRNRVEQSPVLAEMNNLIQLKEKELEYRRKTAKKEAQFMAAPDNQTEPMSFEVGQAEEALIQVRMQRAQLLAHAGGEAGDNMLEGFNRELIDLGVDAETNAVELELLQSRLAEVRERRLLELADRYRHEVEQPLDMLEMMMHELLKEQFELMEKLRGQRMPEVTVIGG